MATIDMTHGKIHFPPRFLPYLEKHRLFELLHECVEMLIQVQPKDHVQFLRNVIMHASGKKDKQRIVFMTPASFDRETFAELLSQCLGIQNVKRMRLDVITRERVTKAVEIEKLDEVQEEESCICPEELGEAHYPDYFPIWGEEPPYYFDDLGESEKTEEEEKKTAECEGEDKLKEPCVCVCPCVKQSPQSPQPSQPVIKKVEIVESEKDYEELGESEETSEEKDITWIKKKSEVTVDEKQNDTKSKGKKYESFLRLADVKTRESKASVVEIDYGILAEHEMAAKGWILADFAMTGQEARRLNSLGAIPTHAFRIIIDEEEEQNDEEYMAAVQEWKKIYEHLPVMEIWKSDRTIQELAKDLCQILSIMPHRHAPMQIRMVLIGARGSGTTTQAKKFVQKYGLVHVDFDIVKARALLQEDEISKMYKLQQDTRPDPEVEAYILEKALLTPACRACGWVLTGYPKNVDQMRMLDLIATPPNRVVFINVPPKESFVRLYYRKMDSCLGDEYKIPDIEPAGWDTFKAHIEQEVADRLCTTKKNNRKQIIHDIEEYFLEKDKIMAYCGKTAAYVDGNHTVETVFQFIEQILINPGPAVPPRVPFTPGYKVEESFEKLKKFRLMPGLYFNNMLLNPP